MNKYLYSSSDIARELGFPRYVISYYLKKWAIQPTTKIGGRNVYNSAVVRILKEMLTSVKRIKEFKANQNI